jgi:hypothetical protein
MNWALLDALDTKYENESVDCIVDKSLIDTILCYKNRYKHFSLKKKRKRKIAFMKNY